MNNERASEPNSGCSSEETNTSLTSTENTTNQLKSHVVNFKQSKTHLFYVIQSSDNESNEETKRLIRIKISKERPTSKKLATKKMSSRFGNNDDVTDENQERTKRTPRRNLTSIHKRTDHPSFLVLPEVFSKSRGNVNVGKNIERNQSTSENSNETFVIRSKDENKIFASYRKVPTLLGASLWKINSQKVDASSDGVIDQASGGDYCECDKGAARSLTNKSNRDSLNKCKTETTASATNPSPAYLIKDDLFDIHFVQPTLQNASQRLRAGQDRDRRYQSCQMCPNMTKIFPPTSTRRRNTFQSHFSDSDSNSTVKNRSGYVKINFKLVRQCLICGSVNEKCEVLDAIRLRMKSPDFDLAMNTIEDIVKFDLFGVQCECRSKPLLEELFWPINVKESHQLQSSIAQFINALVSYRMGRNYFGNRSIIRMLIWGDMGRDNIDAIMRDNLIGIMMKLSCSRFQRSDMIKNGLIRWLLQRMEDDEYSASRYHLQCMAGLLRNLLRGYNLDEFSPIEMRKLFVLLGRYLNTDSVTAKRYICDCLITLFQSTTNVASAKELNFQKVIEEHVTRSVNSKQKEHLRAVHQLFNRSKTSKPFNSQKFASLSEEDPFSDVDLEADNSEEVDYYPGEVLLRDKYSGDAGALGDKKNLKSNPIADDPRKDGKLISRVFVEQLNCFLPDIDKNRIFPLCNARCADKIATCSHIGDIQPKRRQPYIPPNSRTPGLTQRKQSIDDSVEGSRLQSAEQLIPKISTISHDKSAAKWHHFENKDDGCQNATKSSCALKSKMERIFVGPPGGVSERNNLSGTSSGNAKDRLDTELPIDSEGEAIIRSVSFHHDSTEKADILNDKDKQLVAQDSDSSIRKSIRKDKSVKSESQLYDTKKLSSRQPQESISENITLHNETKFSATKDLETHKVIVSTKGDDRLSLGTSDLLTQQSTKEIAKQTNTGENETDRELYDKSKKGELHAKKVELSPKTTSKSKTEIANDQKPVEHTNTNFNVTGHKLQVTSIEVRSPPVLGGKKTHDENLTESQTKIANESEVTPTTKLHARSAETMELSKKARKQSPGPANQTKQLHARSTEEKVGGTRKKNLVGKEIDRDLHVKSTDIANSQAAKKSPRDENQPPLLNARSENLLKKITSEGPAKETEVTTTTKLHARSAEALDHSKKARKLSPGPATKTEVVDAQKDADTSKVDANARRFSEAPTELPFEKNIGANQTKQLHARSTEEKVGETRRKNLVGKEIDRDLHVESTDIANSQAAKKTQRDDNQPPLLNARSENLLKKITSEGPAKETEVTTTTKLHARSAGALDHSKKARKLSPGPATKTEVVDAQKDADTSKVDANARRFSEAPTELPFEKNIGANQTKQLHARSTEEKVGETRRKNLVGKEIDRDLHVESTDIANSQAAKKTQRDDNQPPLLNARSENLLKKITSEGPAKETEVTTTTKLHARSAEALDHSKKARKLSPGPATKTEVVDAQKDADTSKVDANARRFSEAPTELPFEKNIGANQTKQLHARSTEEKVGETRRKNLVGKEIDRDLHVKSTDIANSQAAKKSPRDENQPPLLNARSENLLKKITSEGPAKETEVTTTTKLHARSAEALDHSKKARKLSPGPATKTEVVDAQKDADTSKVDANARRFSEAPTELPFEKNIGANQTKQLHARSTEEKVGETRRKNLVGKEIDRDLHVESTDIANSQAAKKTQRDDNQPPLLNARSENLLKKITSEGPAKETEVTTTTKLHARSAGALDHSKKARKLSPGPATKTEVVDAQKDADTSKVDANARRFSEAPTELPFEKNIGANQTKQLHARSTEEKVGETRRKNLVGKEIDRDLHVESTDIANSQAAKKTQRDDNQPPLLNARSENLLKKITSEGTAKEAEVTTTTKLHARSAETLDHSEKANKVDLNARRFSQTKLQPEKNINANETTEKLHARSIKEKVGETRKKILRKEIDRDAHAETKEITNSQAAEKSTTEKSNQPLPNKTLPENAMSPQPSTVMQPVGGVKSDPLTSNAPAKSKPLNLGPNLHARSEEIVTKPKTSPTVTAKRTNYLLLKHDSDELLGSIENQEYALEPIGNDNSIEQKRMFHQLPARSTELVTGNRKGIQRTQSATALEAQNRSLGRLNNAAFLSGYSSQSSMNKSDGCVDCEGSGYVLRARPSQPCERCKVSLSKYPKFVNALNNQVSEDYQRRVVSRTSEDCIKVTWVKKSDEKISTMPNQGKSNKETLGEPGGKSTETKRNANDDTSVAKKERRLSLQITGEKTKRRSNSASSIRSASMPSEYHKGLSSNVALSRSGSDKSYGTVRENENIPSPKVVENVMGKTIVTSKDDRCLQVVTVTRSQQMYNESVNTDLEMEKLTGSKEQAIDDEECNASNNLLQSNETEPKPNQITVQKPSETTTAVNKSNDETQNFELTSLKALPQEEIERLPSDSIRFETERVTDVVTSRSSLQKLVNAEIGIESHEKLDGALLNNVITESENNTFLTPASGMEVDKKVIGTKSNERFLATPMKKISETVSNSLTAFEDSTSPVMSVSTTDDRPGIGCVKSSPNMSIAIPHAIGRANSSPRLSSKQSENSKVKTPTTDDSVAHNQLALDNGKLDEASNILSTLSEQKTIANRCGSSSTEDVVLEDKQMNNLACDTTVPLANPNEENSNNSQLNYEPIDHEANPQPISGLNLGKLNLPQTFIDPLQWSLARLFPSELPSDAVISAGVKSVGVTGSQVLADRPFHIVIGGIAVAAILATGQLLVARSTNITDATVGEASSPDVVRAETTVQQDNQRTLSDSLGKREQPVVISVNGGQKLDARPLDVVRGENTVHQETRRSLSESLEKREQLDVAGAKGNQMLAASSPNFVRGDNAAQQDNQRTLSESFGKREQPVVVGANGGQKLGARSLDVARGDFSVPQDNRNLLRDSMTKSVVIETGCRPVLAARSLVNVSEKTAVQTSINKATLKSNAKITKTDLLPVRSNEMALANIPIRKRKVDAVDNKCENQTEKLAMNKLVKIIEKEPTAKQGSGNELTDNNKMFRSQMSIVFDEILIKEMNLRPETQTKRNDQEINRELSHGHFRFSGGERERKGRHKVRFVNSTCCRQLLNNEELINRLSEKVLEKLITEIHNCGPNCKSPCGGLNSKFNAKTGNYRNLE